MRHGNDKKERNFQPREWTLEETLERGKIRAEITTSRNQSGTKMHSVSIRKKILDRDGNPVIDDDGRERTTGFFRGEDMRNIADLCEEAQQWIDADKHEDRQARSIRNGRRGRTHQRA